MGLNIAILMTILPALHKEGRMGKSFYAALTLSYRTKTSRALHKTMVDLEVKQRIPTLFSI